jgi:hypothetical protein
MLQNPVARQGRGDGPARIGRNHEGRAHRLLAVASVSYRHVGAMPHVDMHAHSGDTAVTPLRDPSRRSVRGRRPSRGTLERGVSYSRANLPGSGSNGPGSEKPSIDSTFA